MSSGLTERGVPERLRVLMVGTDAEARRALASLAAVGFTSECRCIQTESAFVSELEEPWDLVICDCQRESFNPLRALSELRIRSHETPFVLLGAALGTGKAIRALAQSSEAYLVGDDSDQLGATVLRLLSRGRTGGEPGSDEEREQRRSRTAARAAGAFPFEHDVPLGPSLDIDSGLTAWLGYEPDELPHAVDLAQWILSALHPDNRASAEEEYRSFLEGDSPRFTRALRVKHKAGYWVDVVVSIGGVERDGNNRVTRAAGIALDATELRRLERLARQTEVMKQLAGFNDLLATDLNDFLTAILGFGSLAVNALPSGQVAQDVSWMLEATTKASELMAATRSFVQLVPPLARTLNVNEWIRSVEGSLRTRLGPSYDLSTKLSEDLWLTRIDPQGLDSALTTLLDVCRASSTPGREVWIATTNRTLDGNGKEDTAGAGRGDYVVIRTGTDASAAADRDRLAQPLISPRDELLQCLRVVTQAGGFIRTDGALGPGTTAEIYLPRVRAVPSGPAADELQGGTETILVVERDPLVRTAVSRSLSAFGYRPVTASTGNEALELLRRSMAVDLVVVDLSLPELRARAFARELRSSLPSARLLFTSALPHERLVQQGVIEPSCTVLIKPFTPSALAGQVRQVLDG